MCRGEKEILHVLDKEHRIFDFFVFQVGVGIAVGVNKEKFIGEIERRIDQGIIANYSFVNTIKNAENPKKIDIPKIPPIPELVGTNVINTVQLWVYSIWLFMFCNVI